MVWTTAMMFFQVALLGGYLYAYCTIRYLRASRLALLHIAMLAGSLLVLPILPSPSWKPASDAAPTLHILVLLAITVGLPYFLLSTTGPLMQAWYWRTRKGVFPYRLYALSNLGSMLALVGFPFVVEPLMSSRAQALTWSAGYVLFVVLCGLTAWKSRRGADAAVRAEFATEATSRPAAGDLLLWTMLAACPSVLLLAVTSHVTQNVAPVPFLWVLPLSLYLLSFIFCFESDHVYQRKVFVPLVALALAGMTYVLYLDVDQIDLKWQVPVFAMGLFLCCMCCHGELAKRKPHPRYLTLFYLTVSIGGALGGLFVALGAPHLFRRYLELPVGLVACAALMTIALWRTPDWIRSTAAIFTAMLAIYAVQHESAGVRRFKLAARNFYGVLSVREESEDSGDAVRILYHGVISHGKQLLDPGKRRLATSYYGPKSGVGRAIRAMGRFPSARIGVIGLGAGTLASYGRASDVYRFYEINPLVAQLSNTEFTYLKDCPADKQVLLGDARLTLERQEPQQFDVLAVDAFSSDSVPVHLLTREAFEVYFRHIKPQGILAVHISNRYLNLAPVVAHSAAEVGRHAIVVEDDGEDADYLSDTTWVLVTGDSKLDGTAFEGASMEPAKLRPEIRTWTDDYSNLFQVLK